MDPRKREKLWWIASLGAVVGLVIASFILPGGDDLYRYYQPFARGCLDCGFVPYFAQWFLWPLLLFNNPVAWPFWTLLCLTGFFFLLRYTKTNPFYFLISFPMMGQIWLGQIDVLVCIGLVIIAFTRNPFLRGFGIVLAAIKIQSTALVIIFMLMMETRANSWKLLVPPVLVMLVSLFIYGPLWPYYWLQNAFSSLPVHVWRLAGMASWRYAIFLIPFPLLFHDRRKRMISSLLISSLATPFFGVYSYILFLIFDTPWWAVLVSYAWIIALPFVGEVSLQYAWILPISLLFCLTLRELRERRKLLILNEGSSHA